MTAPLLKPLNLFILCCLVIFGLLYYYSGQQEAQFRDSSHFYLESVLTDISRWQPEILRHHLAPEARARVSDSQLESVLAQYRPLGPLVSMDEPVLSRLSAALSAFTDQRRLSYSFEARFEQGRALVTATLLERDGQFSLYNFNITRSDGQ